jgi:hypothetical protein
MNDDFLQIEIYDKREGVIEAVVVEKLSASKFRVAENAVLLCRLTVGTEFETRINKNSKYEVTRITKDSDFVTRRFMLDSRFSEADYRVLGDEIIRQGGFWQVDFGSIATVNLPRNSPLDLDEIFRVFNFQPAEIVDE